MKVHFEDVAIIFNKLKLRAKLVARQRVTLRMLHHYLTTRGHNELDVVEINVFLDKNPC